MYTVIIRMRNDFKHLPIVTEAWRLQTLPPAEILIVDGSDKPTAYKLGVNERYIHTGPGIAKQTNEGVKACKTDMFILSNSDIVPHPQYASEQYAFTTPYTLVFGIWVDVPDFDHLPDVDIYPPFLQHIYYYGRERAPVPHDVAMHHKATFLWYNEALIGKGCEDSEYLFRWLLNGNKCFRNSRQIFYHERHERYTHTDPFKFNLSVYQHLIGMYITIGLPKFNDHYCIAKPENYEELKEKFKQS